MSVPEGRTLFKKKDGVLSLTADYQHVTWTPKSGGLPTVSLPVVNITNLQQTPEGNPKVMLKILEKSQSGGDPVSYLFHFNTSEARAEAQSMKDLLSKLIADMRSKDQTLPKPIGAAVTENAASMSAKDKGGSASATMAFASAANSVVMSSKWFDDSQLRNDIELQQSLMKKDVGLHQTYMEAIRTKPDSISGTAFNAQFWSTRTNLLRAHAIDINQKKGAYNILSTVKPRTVDGELKLSISVEQVQMIFAQHPLVKRIYNENVPKVTESQFWSRFFLSKLSKRLRGERVSEADQSDVLFDRYDISENAKGIQSKIMSQSVPHFIDIEGNEENQGGFRSGNAKDVEMRPRHNIPIVKTLNSLSERIMANVAPSDANPEESARAQDSMHDQLALRDLMPSAGEYRVKLTVNGQNSLFSEQDVALSNNAKTFAQQKRHEVLAKVWSSLAGLRSEGMDGIDLQASTGFNEDSESDEETSSQQCGNFKTPFLAAEQEVMNGVQQQRGQLYGDASDATTPMGLPIEIAEKCALTHATTVEFLHQFWNAFLSGDAERAAELRYLAESLKRSAERIAVIADEAEKERNRIIQKRKVEIRDHYQQTGKKIKWKPDQVGGGFDAASKLLRPLLTALDKAQTDYTEALAAEGIRISTKS